MVTGNAQPEVSIVATAADAMRFCSTGRANVIAAKAVAAVTAASSNSGAGEMQLIGAVVSHISTEGGARAGSVGMGSSIAKLAAFSAAQPTPMPLRAAVIKPPLELDEPPNSSTGTPPLNSQHLSDHSSHGVRDSIAAAELQEASIPGQARSAILSAQLARIRQDRTDAVTGAAHAMVILQSKITQLRDAGIKSAVREMALRHQCAELQQSNEAWMRESSQARASSISGAFDSLDADALAAGIFKAETQGIFSCERGVDGAVAGYQASESREKQVSEDSADRGLFYEAGGDRGGSARTMGFRNARGGDSGCV